MCQFAVIIMDEFFFRNRCMYFCVIFTLGYMRLSLSLVSHAPSEFVINGKMMRLLFYGVICVVYLY